MADTTAPLTSTPSELTREYYSTWLTIPTRWSDFDVLRHLNNVMYMRFYETAAVDLVGTAGLDRFEDQTICFVVENSTKFLRPVPMVKEVEIGLRITKMGRTSATYGLALFLPCDPAPKALGSWVHVFVDRDTERPAPIPATIHAHYQNIIDGQN